MIGNVGEIDTEYAKELKLRIRKLKLSPSFQKNPDYFECLVAELSHELFLERIRTGSSDYKLTMGGFLKLSGRAEVFE